jgi:hypothetical protein
MNRTNFFLLTALLGIVSLWAGTSKSMTGKSDSAEANSAYHCTKSGAPVSLKSKTFRLDPGESATFEATLNNNGPDGTVSISVAADPAIAVQYLDNARIRLRRGESTQLRFHVSGNREGRYYIRLRTTWNDGRIRTFALPVQVGAGKAKLLKSAVHKGPHGEKIIIYKAREKSR